MDCSMKLIERTADGVTILDLKGRLVLEDGGDLFLATVNRLVGEGVCNVLVNFDECTYLDSAGLGILVSKYVTLKNRGGTLKVCNLHRRSFEVLTITRLLSVFESFPSEAAALASFRAAT